MRGAARCRGRALREPGYSWRTKVALVLAPIGQASRRFATMAQIESKHDVRRKVRDAQAQVNRERLKRESDNREDMVAFLVAEQKLSAGQPVGSRTARASPAGRRTTPRGATPGRCPSVGADA